MRYLIVVIGIIIQLSVIGIYHVYAMMHGESLLRYGEQLERTYKTRDVELKDRAQEKVKEKESSRSYQKLIDQDKVKAHRYFLNYRPINELLHVVSHVQEIKDLIKDYAVEIDAAQYGAALGYRLPHFKEQLYDIPQVIFPRGPRILVHEFYDEKDDYQSRIADLQEDWRLFHSVKFVNLQGETQTTIPSQRELFPHQCCDYAICAALPGNAGCVTCMGMGCNGIGVSAILPTGCFISVLCGLMCYFQPVRKIIAVGASKQKPVMFTSSLHDAAARPSLFCCAAPARCMLDRRSIVDGEIQKSMSTGGHDVHLLLVDDNSLVTGAVDGVVQVWDYELEEQGTSLQHGSALSALATSDNCIVSADYMGKFKIWDKPRRILLHTIAAHHGEIYKVIIDNQGDIITIGADHFCRLWSSAGRQLDGQKHFSAMAHTMVMQSDGTYITAAQKDLVYWKKQDGKLRHIKTIPYPDIIESLVLGGDDFLIVKTERGLHLVMQDQVVEAFLKKLSWAQLQFVEELTSLHKKTSRDDAQDPITVVLNPDQWKILKSLPLCMQIALSHKFKLKNS